MINIIKEGIFKILIIKKTKKLLDVHRENRGTSSACSALNFQMYSSAVTFINDLNLKIKYLILLMA